MVKVLFNESTQEWDVLEDADPRGIYLDGYLKSKLDNVRKILKKLWDAVILIDGKERSGKSTLAMTIAHYLSDSKFNEQWICSGFQDAKDKISNCPNGSTLILDEGSLVFNSKDAIRRENVILQKILDVVGQKNLTLIVVLPSFFDLNKNIACRRSRFLLHVYTDEELNRGYFAYYGEKSKNLLYELGKKNFGSYSKPSSEFQGKFTNFQPEYLDKYLEIKKASLMEALNSSIKNKGTTNNSKLDIIRQIREFRKQCPEVTLETLFRGFGVSDKTYYRHKRLLDKEEEDKGLTL